jgi:hypothetical protein
MPVRAWTRSTLRQLQRAALCTVLTHKQRLHGPHARGSTPGLPPPAGLTCACVVCVVLHAQAICTGFYFVRSNPRTIAIFRRTQGMIVAKRKIQPRWQASDQWAINHAVDEHEVVWQTPMPMRGISDYVGKYEDPAAAVGFTRKQRTKFVVLPHVHVARACPILKHGTREPPASERVERKKWALWRKLLATSCACPCPYPRPSHASHPCP